MRVFQKFAVSFIVFVLSECSNEAVFRKNKQKYLANHVIETKQAKSEFECGLLCARRSLCTSANYKTSGEDKGRCELNNKTMQATTNDDEQTNHEFNHLVIIKRNPTTSSCPTPEESFTSKSYTTNVLQSPASTLLETNSSTPQLSNTSLTCSNADWRQSFDSFGYSKCGQNLFITGFYRSPPNDSKHPISLLEGARCCMSSLAYSGQNSQCNKTGFKGSFKKNDTWNRCPKGYFLKGLRRNNDTSLRAITGAFCCKPENHPDKYGPCYDKDVGSSFDREGWSNCSKAGYYITGLYRGSGQWLNDIDKFRCCQNA
ncbi:uncharacterized protein LOC114525902 [Dendronephthya gigantea]|uniref:uncharacterized protein LOC114525902 n=1 Tax=Dendronephthya gigantea TaxID=151771 RepID=UPI00106A9276|nr:uncharacterized protein LOC114525902 [Dendronephthya gigantea]